MLNATIGHYPKLFKKKLKTLQSEIQDFGIFASQVISNYLNKTESGLIEFSIYSY